MIIRLFRFLKNVTKLHILQTNIFEKDYVWHIGKHSPI